MGRGPLPCGGRGGEGPAWAAASGSESLGWSDLVAGSTSDVYLLGVLTEAGAGVEGWGPVLSIMTPGPWRAPGEGLGEEVLRGVQTDGDITTEPQWRSRLQVGAVPAPNICASSERRSKVQLR